MVIVVAGMFKKYVGWRGGGGGRVVTRGWACWLAFSNSVHPVAFCSCIFFCYEVKALVKAAFIRHPIRPECHYCSHPVTPWGT